MLTTKEQVEQFCRDNGVVFLDHREAAVRHVSNLAAWSGMAGFRNYAESVWVTLRPHIVHPETVNQALPGNYWRVVAHELEHWQRQPGNAVALWGWIARYAFSQKFRALEEMHAHLVDLHTGRKGPDIVWLVEEMRDWYKLSNIDPEWMIEWLTSRFESQQ